MIKKARIKPAKVRRKYAYAPSLTAAVFGITAKKKPSKKLFTGLEPRPLIPKKKAKKKKIGGITW